MFPKLFLIVPATPCLSILTRGMCHCATTNYFRLQSGASFPTTACEFRRLKTIAQASGWPSTGQYPGGGSEKMGLAGQVTGLGWAPLSSSPFQVFQQEKEGDEVGVGQGAE